MPVLPRVEFTSAGVQPPPAIAMLDYLVNATVTLFVTLDPIGLTPLFMAMTAGRPQGARRNIARTACVIAALVLMGSSLFGAWLLDSLGISLQAFRIAGGLLLFWIAFEMVFDLRGRRKAGALDETSDYESVAAFPLAVPLMAGPGSISATILIASQAPDAGSLIGLNAVIIVIILGCFALFLLSDPVERLLRRTGRIVITRLLGVMLAALSVQFVADGVRALTAAAAIVPAAAP